MGLGRVSGVAYVGWHLVDVRRAHPVQTNLVYDGASMQSVLGAHLGFEDRVYRLWGLFVDRRFGIGRWAPVFLAVLPALPLAWRALREGRFVVSAVVVQILVATFLSVTMMGWWFPGRMLIVVLPLFAFVLTVLLIRLPRPAQLVAAIAGGYSLLVTALARRRGAERRGRAGGRPVRDERVAVPGAGRRLPGLHVVVRGDDRPQRRVAGRPAGRDGPRRPEGGSRPRPMPAIAVDEVARREPGPGSGR